MNLQNLIDYCRGQGLPSPFSGAYVPEPLNIDTCISAIMIRCGLLTPVYLDPETFTNVVKNWFDRKQWTFEHLINIVQAEYSPIENYVRYDNKTLSKDTSETHTGGYKDATAGKDTTELSGKDTTELSGKDTTELSGTDERDISDGGTDTTYNEISAFNSSGYQSDNKSLTDYGKTVDDDITYGKQEDITYGKQEDVTYGKQEDITYGKTITRTYEHDKTTYTGSDTETNSGHGNIGVTTNQQMIEQELALLRHFDIYGYIAEQFEYDNMLMIY